MKETKGITVELESSVEQFTIVIGVTLKAQSKFYNIVPSLFPIVFRPTTTPTCSTLPVETVRSV